MQNNLPKGKYALLSLAILTGLFLGGSPNLLAQENQSPPVPQAPTETDSHPPGKIKKTWQKIKRVFTDEPSNAENPSKQPSQTATTSPRESSLPSLESLKGKPKTAATPPKPKAPAYAVTTTPDGYQLAMPGYKLQFPKDHASHPKFKTEWWYYTGHLHTEDGERYGYELTFFRSGIPLNNPPSKSLWRMKDIYAAHFAVSDIKNKHFAMAERLNRNSPYPGSGLAQADSNRFYVLNDTWGTWQVKQTVTPLSDNVEAKLETKTNKKTILSDAKAPKTDVTKMPSFWLQADMSKTDVQPLNFWEGIFQKPTQYKLALNLTPLKAPVIHGNFGVSQKATCKGCASHYYSMTKLYSKGTIWVNGKPKRVTGISWMDREFGSNQLTKEQTGWDWFSIQLDNNTELMLYVLRNERKKDGKLVQYIDPNSSGTLVFANGESLHLKKSDFRIKALNRWRSSATGGYYPMGWQVYIPKYNIDLTLKPEMENQELVTHQSTKVAYWEGTTRVYGIYGHKKVSGVAYVEMTGYAQKFRQRI